ncbi:GIBBERELLIN-RESPONSIVE PROTEIN putative-RELATED [Salix purpurea]|uniref:GIBBERELLIN-RESPONSIVE PROTEIN putative-RELATED n=1 Tax=Salix purpurea TaxID=77065 RepID=A0A9Q1A148_SALPP|nr:GIBBERELLIN-RESPONSIVE PROTEIN putative-RELATED [Salix purpurea]
MQTSQKKKISDGSRRFGDQPMQYQESYSCPPIQNIDVGSQGTHLLAMTYDQYCTLESSSEISACPVHNSPSTASSSPNECVVSQPNSQSYHSDLQDSSENTSGSPGSESYVTHKLRELETAMLGPDSDNLDMYNMTAMPGPNQIVSEAEKWKFLVEMMSRGDLKEALCTCALAISNSDMFTVEWLMSELRQMVSVTGEPIQRLGAYMLEGLVARLASSGSSIYKALRCKEPAGADLLSYMHLLYEVCPYFKFGYMSANGAIADAVKDEISVHIIDFQIAQGSQWVTLLQALAARPGGPPHIRITGIDDSTSAYARGGGLDIVGKRLLKLAESYKVPFEFHAAGVSASEIQVENLGIQPGEAVVVNFALSLHHLPDGSVGTQNHRDRLLRLVKSLSPKVVTLIEQESNTSTVPFFARFVETLNYYQAIFESIDVTLPREHKERINVEQHCLAREVVNIIACEGAERVERHEHLGKWISRFEMAGFTPYPLSSFVNFTIKTLLQNYSEKYTLEERDGALFLGWMNRPLVAACAWR